jgi:hypothetical protein
VAAAGAVVDALAGAFTGASGAPLEHAGVDDRLDTSSDTTSAARDGSTRGGRGPGRERVLRLTAALR